MSESPSSSYTAGRKEDASNVIVWLVGGGETVENKLNMEMLQKSPPGFQTRFDARRGESIKAQDAKSPDRNSQKGRKLSGELPARAVVFELYLNRIRMSTGTAVTDCRFVLLRLRHPGVLAGQVFQLYDGGKKEESNSYKKTWEKAGGEVESRFQCRGIECRKKKNLWTPNSS